jgi:hypothetical protein
MPSSGVWRSVDVDRTDVSEGRIASIFRVEKSASEEPAHAHALKLWEGVMNDLIVSNLATYILLSPTMEL